MKKEESLRAGMCSSFPHEIVYPILVGSVHKNCITSSAQITLTLAPGFRSAMGGSETGKFGKITCVRKARGIRREVSRKL